MIKQGGGVCQVLYSFNTGGSERLAEELSYKFSAAGIEVSVCATRTGNGVIGDRLRKKGHECLALDLERRPRLLRLFYQLKLAIWFRKRRFSALFVHHLPMLNDVYRSARLAGINKIIVTEHTARTLRADPKFRALASRVLKLSVVFVAVNSDVADAMIEINPDLKGEVTVIENGVNTSLFCPADDGDIVKDPNAVSVGWVGRLHAVKDVETAVRAFESAAKTTDVPMILKIIGDGEEKTLLQRIISESPVADKIEYLGERSDIASLMRTFDIFLISSTEEGTPLTVLEAMSSSLPIVATAVGGIPEAVSDAVGILAEAKDVSGLSKALETIASDRQLREQMGAAARERVLTNYSLDRTCAGYLDLLR